MTVGLQGQNLEDIGFQSVQAMAVEIDGFTFRQDFMSVVKNYLREEMTFWPLIPKEAAEADQVQELYEGTAPAAGFMSKIDLNPPENPTDLPAHNLTGLPQGIKAMGGVVKFGHYARSLYAQQGAQFGDIVSRKTKRLIISTAKTIERALFVGNATANPLEFNGIDQQMPNSHKYVCDVTLGDSVVKKLRALVRLATSDSNILRTPTHIFCSGLALELIEEELDAKLEYHNLENIRPGFRVPAIITQAGIIPIIPSPYITDTDGGAGKDSVTFYLMDMNSLSWKGVYPTGGARSFEPQIFEVSQYTTSATPYLVEKRLCLIYGTLFAGNAGDGIYRLTAMIPSGRVGSI